MPVTLHVSLAEPVELDDETRSAIGDLLKRAHPPGLNRFTWDNRVDSVHVLATLGDEMVAYGLLCGRTVWIDGHRLNGGHVEAVAVAETVRGRGYGATMLRQLEALIVAEYEVGSVAAAATVSPLLESRGWQRWAGTTWARQGDELIRTEQHDGRVHLLASTTPTDSLEGEITIEWRDGEVW